MRCLSDVQVDPRRAIHPICRESVKVTKRESARRRKSEWKQREKQSHEREKELEREIMCRSEEE